MRAPVRSSLANQDAEPSRQAREGVHLSKNEKKNLVCKKDKKHLYKMQAIPASTAGAALRPL